MEINNKKESTWVISIGGDYGSYFFDGTEEEAEVERCRKANWEQALGRKRLADMKEIKANKINYCKNHPNFISKLAGRFYCECKECLQIKRKVKKKNNKE